MKAGSMPAFIRRRHGYADIEEQEEQTLNVGMACFERHVQRWVMDKRTIAQQIEERQEIDQHQYKGEPGAKEKPRDDRCRVDKDDS